MIRLDHVKLELGASLTGKVLIFTDTKVGICVQVTLGDPVVRQLAAALAGGIELANGLPPDQPVRSRRPRG